MTLNSIPQKQAPLIQLGLRAIVGAETHGEAIELEHNTSVDISADQYDLTGNPATPLLPGKQAVFNARKEAQKTARAVEITALKSGRDFCRLAMNMLKSVLGSSYNSDWNAAGFLTPSLQVPYRPSPLLLQIRQYFERFPAREVAALNLTAAQAQARVVAIQSAELGVATAKSARVAAKAARDEAQQALYRRLSDLRGELDQLLEDDDGRWYEFGFHRPIDGRIPAPVSGIVLIPLASGIIGVTWDRATRADNYRVKWFVAGGSSPVTEVGLFTERQCTLTGLPATSTIVVAISSRNAAGETAPTEERIVLP